MKKRMVFWSIFLSLLALGLVFTGCDNGTGGGSSPGIETIPSELQGAWVWVRGAYGHTITWIVGSSTVTALEVNDPGDDNGKEVFAVTDVTKGTTAGGWTTYTLTGAEGSASLELNSAGTQIRDTDGDSSDGFPRIYIKLTDISNTVPSVFQGTWKWERGSPSFHTITMTVSSSAVTSFVENDPDSSKNGTEIFAVTFVAKGSTSGGWTTYYFVNSNIGTLPFELNTAGTQYMDTNGQAIDGFPRVYNKISDGGGGGLTIGTTSATLFIDGLGEVYTDEDSDWPLPGPHNYNGYYAFIITDSEEPGYADKDLFAANNITEDGLITLGQIADNNVTLSVWEVIGDFPDILLQPYTGSDLVNLDIMIFETEVISLDDFIEAMSENVEEMNPYEIKAFLQKYNMIAFLDGDAQFTNGTGTASSLSTEFDIRWLDD